MWVFTPQEGSINLMQINKLKTKPFPGNGAKNLMCTKVPTNFNIYNLTNLTNYALIGSVPSQITV